MKILKKIQHMSLGDLPIDFNVNFARKEDVYISASLLLTHTWLPHVSPCVSTWMYKSKHSSCVALYTPDGRSIWPFKGKITIQIINQAGDHSHFGQTVIKYYLMLPVE